MKMSTQEGYELGWVPTEATLADAHKIRRAVFMDEQGVSEAVEMDDKDDECNHVVAFDGEKPVATARLRRPEPEVAKMERVAVLEAYRGEGLGQAVMKALERKARDYDCTVAKLHGQTTVEQFYQSLGYETVSDEFLEADIPHVKMEKQL